MNQHNFKPRYYVENKRNSLEGGWTHNVKLNLSGGNFHHNRHNDYKWSWRSWHKVTFVLFIVKKWCLKLKTFTLYEIINCYQLCVCIVARMKIEQDLGVIRSSFIGFNFVENIAIHPLVQRLQNFFQLSLKCQRFSGCNEINSNHYSCHCMFPHFGKRYYNKFLLRKLNCFNWLHLKGILN